MARQAFESLKNEVARQPTLIASLNTILTTLRALPSKAEMDAVLDDAIANNEALEQAVLTDIEPVEPIPSE